jgi:ZIP family zinc transporter
MAIIVSLLTFVSTLLGGLASIKYRNRLQLILGFTAGVLMGLVALEILPEIIRLVEKTKTDPRNPMIALLAGFLIFHILEKTILVHHDQEGSYEEHRHPSVGLLSAIGLTTHSFLDGVGIGLGFSISSSVGILIAVAVVSHDFSDGLNTGSLMLVHQNTLRRTLALILADAIAPVLGAASTLFFRLPDEALLLYLGFFAGFLLYIGIAVILTEAYEKSTSLRTVAMTILGVTLIFLVSRVV